MTAEVNSSFLDKIKSELPEIVSDVRLLRDHYCFRVDPSDLLTLVKHLKDKNDFEVLLNVTAVDYLDSNFEGLGATERFDVVYHLLSISNKLRVRIKVAAPESAPEVESLSELYQSANFLEREVWDLSLIHI